MTPDVFFFFLLKRSRDILKIKRFQDAEYTVTGVKTGPVAMIENGNVVVPDVVTALLIKHKGNEVAVGSGLTMKQRKDFMENPHSIIGKVITVQYFAETTTHGVNSLRFPLLKVVHGKKRSE